uniref:Uncharacterized protein n=1 Tax=Calidris pygmaea TaxID=425635 RepID=A0A8C3J0M3_9CHAR
MNLAETQEHSFMECLERLRWMQCPCSSRRGALSPMAWLNPAHCIVVAFLVAYHQNKQLIGEKGLLPCKLYLQNVKKYFKGKINLDALSYAPTIIWFLDWSDMDSTLDYLSLLGLATSAFILITGCANMVLMFLLWVLYLSLVNVGQIWYVNNLSAFFSFFFYNLLLFIVHIDFLLQFEVANLVRSNIGM